MRRSRRQEAGEAEGTTRRQEAGAGY